MNFTTVTDTIIPIIQFTFVGSTSGLAYKKKKDTEKFKTCIHMTLLFNSNSKSKQVLNQIVGFSEQIRTTKVDLNYL